MTCMTRTSKAPNPIQETPPVNPVEPVQPPEAQTPGSLTFNGPGNLLTQPIQTPKPKIETANEKKAKQLTKALKICRKKHNHHKRAACEHAARKKYGAKKSSRSSRSNRRASNAYLVRKTEGTTRRLLVPVSACLLVVAFLAVAASPAFAAVALVPSHPERHPDLYSPRRHRVRSRSRYATLARIGERRRRVLAGEHHRYACPPG